MKRLFVALVAAMLGAVGCDDDFMPPLDKQQNLPPETFLIVDADSLQAQLYRLSLRWLGSDPDGRVVSFRVRWLCAPGPAGCLLDEEWVPMAGTSGKFFLPVPNATAHYTFEVAAVDNDGEVDPSPKRQEFALFNSAPVVQFESVTLPVRTLPAVTFFLRAADPDSTPDDRDHDSRANIAQFRAWLDGAEDRPIFAAADGGSITLRPVDFDARFGERTVFIQSVDDGQAASTPVQHTWTVESAPENGILLVDDCRLGGNLEVISDRSFTAVLQAAAPDRWRELDIATVGRLTAADLEATLLLFGNVIWYTDADNQSSGALELAAPALADLLRLRSGRMLLSSGLVFGTRSAFGELEPEFRQLFGIAEVFPANPTGDTNFTYSQRDSAFSVVRPELPRIRMRTLGIGAVMECFKSRTEATTQTLYFYPPGRFVRGDVTNLEQFDVGVYNESSFGSRTVYVSLPIGLPINTQTGENEAEIQQLLRLIGILEQ